MSAGVAGVSRCFHSGVTVALIKSIVAEASGLTLPQLLSDRRCFRLVEARGIVSYLAHRRTPLSLPAIGRQLGDRDHTTIRNHVLRVVDRMSWDEGFAIKVAGLEALVLAHVARQHNRPDAEKLARAIYDDPRRADRITASELFALAAAHLDACERLEALRDAPDSLAFETATRRKEIADVH